MLTLLSTPFCLGGGPVRVRVRVRTTLCPRSTLKSSLVETRGERESAAKGNWGEDGEKERRGEVGARGERG